MGIWTADFSNDPENDFNLYVELLEDDEYKARLYYDMDERLYLRFYGGSEVILCVDWLTGIIKDMATSRINKSQPTSDEQ